MKLEGKKIAFCLTNVIYTYQKTITEMKNTKKEGAEIIPIMQPDTYLTKNANNYVKEIEEICNKKIIINREEAEKIQVDIITITPCSGNYIKKLANSIYDTTILSIVKNHIQENTPIVLGIIVKDGLSTNAENIGKLLNKKNIYFIPFSQSNPITKPYTLSFYPEYITKTLEDALNKKQIQPIIMF